MPDTVAESFSDYILLYLQVLIYEIGTISRVCHNAPDMSCGKDYGFRLFGIEKSAYSDSVKQIELGMCAANDIYKTSLPKVCHDGRAYKTAVSGDIYLRVLCQHRITFLRLPYRHLP